MKEGPLAVGFGAGVAVDRMIAVAKPDSAPIVRAVRRAEEDGLLIDLTYGRRVRAVLFLDTGHVVRVTVSPETMLSRWARAGLVPGAVTLAPALRSVASAGVGER